MYLLIVAEEIMLWTFQMVSCVHPLINIFVELYFVT